MEPLSFILIAGALVVGLLVGKFVFGSISAKKAEEAKKEAEIIIKDATAEAERVKKSRMLESKEKYLSLKAEHEKETHKKNKRIEENIAKLKEREQSISNKMKEVNKKEADLDSIKGNLNQQLELVSVKKAEVEKAHAEHVRKLESLSNMSADDAKEQLIESLKEEAKTDAMGFIKDIVDEAKLKANKEAKKIVIQTIQRTAAENTLENTVSVFNLPSDDVKGQIIGREGRNIRALEAATGVELVVDDTPEAIVISGFDSIRREIARLSLQRLVTDGRIHPARIEEIVAKTKKQLEDQIVEIGERTVIELGIHGLHPELVRIVGRMRFRSSYGQNLLQHSRETANLCAIMAAELGLNTKLAKRAGLLHDIGKVPDEETELSHALLGMKLAEKYGEHPSVCNAIGAHHDEVEMEYVISPIIQACDAISGARPGARREIMESYIQRLKDMENLAMANDGVEKAYAIQAGRELRVIVSADKVADNDADTLSFAISEKIQNEMVYPGQVKVTVIREKRAVSYAK